MFERIVHTVGNHNGGKTSVEQFHGISVSVCGPAFQVTSLGCSIRLTHFDIIQLENFGIGGANANIKNKQRTKLICTWHGNRITICRIPDGWRCSTNTWKWVCKLQSKSMQPNRCSNLINMLCRGIYSFAVWIRHTVCRGISARTTVRSAEQHCRNTFGRLQNGNTSAPTTGRTGRRYWCLVRNIAHNYLYGGCLKCIRHCLYERLHTANGL